MHSQLVRKHGDTAILTNALDCEIIIGLVIKFTLIDAELKTTDINVKSEHAMVRK